MNDHEFSRMLHLILLKQSSFRLPYPPKTINEQVKYMEFAGRYLCPSYQMEWPGKSWYDSKEIMDFCAQFPYEWHRFNLGRKYNFMQILKLISNVHGETAECGVFSGASSWIILKYAGKDPDGNDRAHHLFDSFEGLSEPDAEDDSHWLKGALAYAETDVRKNLDEFEERCFYYKGWIPDRFQEVADKKFAFVHIDVDLTQPTRDSIEFFYPRLSEGAVLVCDDYGSALCSGATRAIDDFLADKPEKMIGFSTAAGFFIKSKASR